MYENIPNNANQLSEVYEIRLTKEDGAMLF